jgi:hypothetical protein
VRLCLSDSTVVSCSNRAKRSDRRRTSALMGRMKKKHSTVLQKTVWCTVNGERWKISIHHPNPFFTKNNCGKKSDVRE